MTENHKENRLVLQKRTLHYVTSVCVRNFTIPKSNTLEGVTSPRMYITVHSHNNGLEKLFESERNNECCNPTWCNMRLPNAKPFKVTAFILRLWVEANKDSNIVFEWNVSLSALTCYGKSLCNNKLQFLPNSVVFRMHKMFYCSTSSLFSQPSVSLWKNCFSTSDPKLSYNICALQKYLLFNASTATCKKRVESFSQHVKDAMNRNKEITQLNAELIILRDRIAFIKDLVKREQLLLRNERKEADTITSLLREQEKQHKESEENFIEDAELMRNDNESCIESKVKTSQQFKQLALRRRDILTELTDIFPISVINTEKDEKSSKATSSTTAHAVCNVRLPDPITFNQREEASTSVALGYTAQLLSMMSHFMLVPLRYPIVEKGSLSCVFDHVTEKLSERERMFPLYSRGSKDRFLSEYGIFLLNKNIAQLRYFCGLGTLNIKSTLKNIKSLLEERLGATSNFVGSNPSKPISIIDSNNKNKISDELTSAHVVSLISESGPDNDSEIPTPSTGYNHTISPNYSRTSTFTNELKRTSPRRRTLRGDNRHQDLQTLRGELLGVNDRTVRKSPDNNRRRTRLVSNDSAMAPVGSRSSSTLVTHHSYKSDFDSIESVGHVTSRRALTGLEEIISQSESGRNAKLPLANARAELLGKRANRSARDTAALWSRAPPTGTYLRKRNELFQKQNLSGENRSGDSDEHESRSRYSSNASGDYQENSGSSPHNSTESVANNPEKRESETNPFLDIASQEVERLIDPDVLVLNQGSNVAYQLDDEIDLC